MSSQSPIDVDKLKTIFDVLRSRADHLPNKIAYSFLQEGEIISRTLTYRELDTDACRLASRLRAVGREGDRVMILLPSGLEYVISFFACLYAGRVAVPAYPPMSDRNMSRLLSILEDSGATVALMTKEVLGKATPLIKSEPVLNRVRLLEYEAALVEGTDGWTRPGVDEKSLALLQYTSGSTGKPKGVMISHENLLYNEHLIHTAFKHARETRLLFWLPLFHDMGLIGTLQTVYAGGTCYLMSPEDFLQKPVRWLAAISNHRVSTSGAPNFAYEYCVRKIEAGECEGLDLSSWDLAFNGAERVRAATLRAFSDKFRAFGFSMNSFYPCYGLAEATLIVSGGAKESLPVYYRTESKDLGKDRVNTPDPGQHQESRTFVSCGHSLPGQTVIVVDPDSMTECDDGQVGELWVGGKSVARGYWGKPSETRDTFNTFTRDLNRGPFLRTGDLGFKQQGELIITGRLKDLIIIRGSNYYPDDIESTVQKSHAMIRPGCGTAFTIEVEGEERLVIAQELNRRPDSAELNSVFDAIRESIAQTHSLSVFDVVLLDRNRVPKTSSGKLQRRSCRELYLQGGLNAIASKGQGQLDGLCEGGPPASDCAPDDSAIRREPSLFSPAKSRRETEPNLSGLRKLAAQVLRVAEDEIQTTRPLIAIGMDSLLIVEFQWLLESRLGVTIPLSTLVDGTSLADIAGAASQPGRSLNTASEQGAAAASGSALELYELSENQLGLWFIQEEYPDSTAYNVHFAARVLSGLSSSRIEQSFSSLLQRHPILRANYVQVDDQVVHTFAAEGASPFLEVDVSGWAESDIREFLLNKVHTPIDLSKDPVARLVLCARAEGDCFLLLYAHHIAVDLWSLEILIEELFRIYRALESGKAPELTPPPRQFADYVRKQKQMLSSERGEALEKFWKGKLGGEPALLNLAGSELKNPGRVYEGDSLKLSLSPSLSRRLKELASEEGATIYTVLLAAYEALLHLYTGLSDFFVGSALSGRVGGEFEDVVGYLVNTLPLKARVDSNDDYLSLLGRTREEVFNAVLNQDLPLPLTMLNSLGRRANDASPIFQTMFVQEKAQRHRGRGFESFLIGDETRQVSFFGFELQPVALDKRTSEFDLITRLIEQGDSIRLLFDYKTSVFERSDIISFSERFENLLEQIAQDPIVKIADLSLCTNAEQKRLLIDWNSSKQSYEEFDLVTNLFDSAVRRTPHAVAVSCAGQTISYDELYQECRRLADVLIGYGVGPDHLVGICLPRSVTLIAAVMATLKAGAAFVPLDPSYPQERIATMIEDSRPSILITESDFASRVKNHAGPTLFLDRPVDSTLRVAPEKRPEIQLDNLAYVMWTSGSTGRPKGVMVSHRSLSNHALTFRKMFGITSTDVALQFSPSSFDAFIEEVFPALITGAQVVLPPPTISDSFVDFTHTIWDSRVSVINIPTPFWEGWVEFLIETNEAVPDPLRLAIIGNVRVNPAKIEAWHHCEKPSGIALVNAYGPTEITATATTYSIPFGSNPHGEIPIGKPNPNTEVYILDKNCRPRPVGLPGELYIGGLGVSRGYLNLPDATAEAYLPNPFSPIAGQRLYKTGDIARYRADGNIEFIGRVDNQVKIRGYRVELGEIEAALERHPTIKRAVVSLKQDRRGEASLVAGVVTRRDSSIHAQELASFLRNILPHYMIPSEIIFFDSLPVTPTGKVDRQAIAASKTAPEGGKPISDRCHVPPQTIVEETLAGIWTQVLNVGTIGVDENFFDLGGHSLLATQVVSRIRKAFDLSFPITKVFELPTIRELANFIEETIISEADELLPNS